MPAATDKKCCTDDWSIYYYQSGWLHGPATAVQLIELINNGLLANDTPMWIQDGAAWFTARRLVELSRMASDETPDPFAPADEKINLPELNLFYAVRSAYDQSLLTREQVKLCNQEIINAPQPLTDCAGYLRGREAITSGQANDLTCLLNSNLTRRQIISGYEIEKKIGSGSTGITYKARQISLDRIVALKILSPRFSHDQQFVTHFFTEARLAAKLMHENIAMVYAVGVSGESHFIAMEYIDGMSLEKTLKQRGRLPEAEAIGYITAIASAMEYALGQSVLHHDISCRNIMLNKQGRPKLIDFGLAKDIHAAYQEDFAGGIGTPAYVSPERALDRHNIDIRSDIYSLGCVFYEMLCGSPPLSSETALETIAMHLCQNVPEVTAPNIGIATRAIIRKMTSRDLEERYKSIGELLFDLNSIPAITFTESLAAVNELPAVSEQLKNCEKQDKIELAIPGNGREYLRLVADEIDRRFDNENVPADFHGFAQSMFEELTANAFRHGIKDEHGLVYLRIEFNPAFFRLEVEDSGEGFDTQKVLREIHSQAGVLKKRSGLAQITQIADSLEYNKKGNKVKSVLYRHEKDAGITAELRNGILFIDVVGKGSTAMNDEFVRYVDNYTNRTNVCLSIRTSWVSSIFVGALVELGQKIEEDGNRLVAWVEQTGCLRVIKQLGVDSLIRLLPTHAAAIAAISDNAENTADTVKIQ